MTGVKASDLAKALCKKGFALEGGKRHDQYYFYFNGKRTSIRVSISRGSGYTYRDSALKYIREEMRLEDKQQFQDFLKCPLTEEMYIQHLRNSGNLRL